MRSRASRNVSSPRWVATASGTGSSTGPSASSEGHGFLHLPARHRAGGRVDRDGRLSPVLRSRRARRKLGALIRLEELVVRMRELERSPVVGDLAGEDAAHPRHQLFGAPGLVEEGEGQDALAVGDLHLEDRSAARPHRPILHPEHLRDDRHVLVDGEIGERGQLPALGVAARIVAEQVGDGAHPERLLERRGRAPAEHTAQLGVEGDRALDGRSGNGTHGSIVWVSTVRAATSSST
jgi:hypothetical protein